MTSLIINKWKNSLKCKGNDFISNLNKFNYNKNYLETNKNKNYLIMFYHIYDGRDLNFFSNIDIIFMKFEESTGFWENKEMYFANLFVSLQCSRNLVGRR